MGDGTSGKGWELHETELRRSEPPQGTETEGKPPPRERVQARQRKK